MTRLRLDLSYDGTDFAGWATQPDQRTVQEALEAALSTVLRVPGVRLVVAGRTDAGVHATGQVAHLDLDADNWQASAPGLIRRLAGVLPADVRVLSVTPVSSDFDARFSALWRRYDYRISLAEFGSPPLSRSAVVAWKRPLDTEVMAQASTDLLGLHDFVALCRRREGASMVRELQRLDVIRTGDQVLIEVQADAFCHSMVRSLVGALAAVGEGRQSRQWLRELLQRSTRADDVTVAPAGGLSLREVRYPDEARYAARAAETRTVRIAAPRAPELPARRSPAPELVDLSVLVHTGMPVYPGDPQVELSSALRIDEHGVNVTAVHAGSQSGTHVDAPNHTLASGLTLSELPLERFTGSAVVADLRGLAERAPITVGLLQPVLDRLERGVILLLCTGWSQFWGSEKYLAHPWLEPAATELILRAGVQTIGIDALSIDASPAIRASDLVSHHLIAAQGGVIAENLRCLDQLLTAQAHGREIEASLFPIRLDAPDGAPVRAVARLS